MAAVGIDGVYQVRRTDAAGLIAAIEEIRRGDLDGANVTMPLKSVALDAVDAVSREAVRAGAVNTLTVRSGSVTGENTDIGGIGDVWSARGLPGDAPVLVLGAGGAAGAALIALGDRTIHLSARRPEAVRRLLDRTGVDAIEVEWGIPVSGAVVVNATPLGMGGESLPADLLDGAVGLVDLAYGSAQTPAVAWARGRMPVADGIDHLVAQAARSFEMWTGAAAPVDVMDRAARA